MFWSYGLSFWLAVMFVTQAVIIAGRRLKWVNFFCTIEELIRALVFASRPTSTSFLPAQAWAALVYIVFPLLLKTADTLADKL